jgi:hypothetical protein
VCVYSFRSKQLLVLIWTLEEGYILLCLQETNLEVREAILAEEQESGLHAPDGRDLSAKLDKTHAREDRKNDECAAEAGRLSQQVMGIANALVDLDMLPV